MMISEMPFSHPFNFNDIQRVHPLSASPSSSAFFRPSSPVQSTSTNNMDDVTTIFVVGFPEDMAEREFQNMFTFCQGFEAASLKWHCKDQEEENIPLNGGKKQMIGFARFRTRVEALEAADVLSGKKIDQDKGTILKAEMAKKNLHIKRGSATQTSTSTSSSTSTSTAATTAVPASSTSTTATATNSTTSMSPTVIMAASLATSEASFKTLQQRTYDSFSPLPSDLLSLQDYKNDLFTDPIASPTSHFNESLFGIRSQSFDQDLGFLSSRTFSLGPSNIQQQHQHQHSNSSHPHLHQQHPHTIQQQQQSRFTQKMMNGLDNDSPYHYLSKSSPTPHQDAIRFDSIEHDLMRIGSLSVSPGNSNTVSSPTTATSAAAAAAAAGQRLPNPADQNPPCNTLYVGNLPPNTSEEELRQVFAVCKGYRRMCFRTKTQGPMCFVEFEEIIFASQALNELQGHNLTNSVKGGIRLSFSKNPLFIKPNKENNVPVSFKQMGNALMNDRRDFMFDPQL